MHCVVQNQLRQQQKVFSQARIVQSQRLKSLRELYDQHVKASQLSSLDLLSMSAVDPRGVIDLSNHT